MFMPFQVLGLWLRWLLSLALVAAGATLLGLWYAGSEKEIVERRTPDGHWIQTDERPEDAPDDEDWRTRRVPWQFGANRETAFLLGGAALLLWSFGGGWLVYPRLLRRGGEGPDQPQGEAIAVRRPDGTALHVRAYGPAGGPTVVMTHGWGLNGDEWIYAARELAREHRVVVWDLPGLGRSSGPARPDWRLEKMAHDLDAVVEASGPGPVVLLGHSIGGMIILTYCRLFPQKLGPRARALVLVHTTYTNPVMTTKDSALMRALQKPVLEPLARLMVLLAPLLRVLNWLGYLDGSAHRSAEDSAFTGGESWWQLDHITRMTVAADPAVVARGYLAMFHYEATGVLPTIPVPTLVVSAGKDEVCLPEASEYMASRIPGARLVEIPQGRHCGLFEFHREFHAAVADFIATTAPGGEEARAVVEAGGAE